jgi:GMP synthase-like glutamine amidotransferase
MPALVVTHSASETPGHLGDWLTEEGLELEVVRPWDGQPLPSLEGYQALVVMGGPQQAYDDGSAPWLRATKDLMREAAEQGLPTFGICLGAQLLAEATGGVVEPGPSGPEIGARLVARRDLAGNDPLFWDLPLTPLVVQWHFDAVTELPPGATLLMSGTAYENQAFRVGDRAWGIQFHVECDAAMVGRWAEKNRAVLEGLGRDVDALRDGAVAALEEVHEVWGEVLRRFARLVQGRTTGTLPVVG